MVIVELRRFLPETSDMLIWKVGKVDAYRLICLTIGIREGVEVLESVEAVADIAGRLHETIEF